LLVTGDCANFAGKPRIEFSFSSTTIFTAALIVFVQTVIELIQNNGITIKIIWERVAGENYEDVYV